MVILFHPNQLKDLTDIQKKLIESLNQPKCYFCKTFPLWIDIPFLNNNCILKNESNLFKSILIDKPQFTKDGKIFCDVKIDFKNKMYSSNLILCSLLSKENMNKTFTLLSFDKIFPINLKIFKLGKDIEIDEHSKAIEDFVWKKLK
jgi:hypothetical protein